MGTTGAPSPGQMYNMVVMVVGQFFLSIVILAGIVWSGMIVPQVSPDGDQISTVLTVLGICFPVLGVVIKRKLLGVAMGQKSGPTGMASRPPLQKLFPAYVVSFACFEAAAVIGFLIYYLTGRAETAAALFAIAAACMVVHWPPRALFEARS